MTTLSLPLALFGMPGGSELIIIAILILVLFGGKKIPELMRGVGKGVGELQKGLDEGKKGLTSMMHDEDEKPVNPVVTPTATPTAPNTTVPNNPPTV